VTETLVCKNCGKALKNIHPHFNLPWIYKHIETKSFFCKPITRPVTVGE
jgi:hypothetical protein